MVNEILTPAYADMMEAISDSTLTELETISNHKPLSLVHASVNYSESAEGRAAFDQYIGAITTKEKPIGFSELQVPPLLWVIFEVNGDWTNVEGTWQRIYSEWLPSSSYELVDGPEILASQEEQSEFGFQSRRRIKDEEERFLDDNNSYQFNS
ncbi:putative transcriptional regulator YdeE [Paenibacillus sp. W4I10]|nr:putative transcriptional regulator YdeE [Paenibacillus sp. W4I10]